VHAAPSAPVCPARHVQDASVPLPPPEKVLFGHVLHTHAPVYDLYVPTSHGQIFASHNTQAAEPVAGFHVPASQGVHAVPSAPVYRARHLQDVRRVLLAAETVLFGHAVQFTAAADEYVFASHGVHVPTPVAVFAAPAPQGVHATPSDEALYPARQVQIELPSAEKVLVGHAVQYAAVAFE
jgi:hypothetical protein